MMPTLVGGAVDNTAGTLSAPDLDINIEWNISAKIAELLEVEPIDDGESGQYTIKVLKMSL